MPNAQEDRLLRVWTPRILRGALLGSMVLLVAGLLVIAVTSPSSYVDRYRAIRNGGPSGGHQAARHFLDDLLHGRGHALLVAGLLLLTLVPIGRVAFTVVVFLRERDWLFAALTALVLALLAVGVLLGRMG